MNVMRWVIKIVILNIKTKQKNGTEENLGCENIRYNSDELKSKVIIFKVITRMHLHHKKENANRSSKLKAHSQV